MKQNKEAKMQSIQLIFHGGAQEIGKSCIEAVFPDKTRILLDCGMKPINVNREYDPEEIFPTTVEDFASVDLVIITHAHIDHSAGVLYAQQQGLCCPVICTPVTKSVDEILFHDTLNIMRERGLGVFTKSDVRNALALMQTDEDKGQVGEVKWKLFPSGHIPGAVCVFLEFRGRSILYTADINDQDTRLTWGCDFNSLPQAEILITEATYGDQARLPREQSEKKFQEIILETIERGGSAVIPAFALSRTQEVLLLANELDLPCSICVDGMGGRITESFLNYPESLRDPGALKEANFWIWPVNAHSRRHASRATQAVYIATSGMVTGGGSPQYIQEKGGDKKNAIILCGYQAPGTGGRQLLDAGFIDFGNGETIKPKCEVVQVHLTTHIGILGMEQLVEAVQPKRILLQHASLVNCQAVAKKIEDWGYGKPIIPQIGDTITA